jgi:hypothetical protein
LKLAGLGLGGDIAQQMLDLRGSPQKALQEKMDRASANLSANIRAVSLP